MKVNVQYAREHFEELLTAAATGEDVELMEEGKPSRYLTLVAPPSSSTSAQKAVSEWTQPQFGLARHTMWLSPDWDSAETNAEIAAEFDQSEIFSFGHAD